LGRTYFFCASPRKRKGFHRGHELDGLDDAFFDAEAAVFDAAEGAEFEAVARDFVDVDGAADGSGLCNPPHCGSIRAIG